MTIVRAEHKHHPWKRWADLPEWQIVFTDDLPFGVWGLTVHDEKTVYLANGMDTAQRRCTAEHERHHALRGPVVPVMQMREEVLVDRLAARALMPSIRRVAHALAFHNARVEPAAEDLWVDEVMLHVRLSSLHRWERKYLDEQLGLMLV